MVGDIDVIIDRKMPVVISADKGACLVLFGILIDVLRVYPRFGVIGVKIPEYFTVNSGNSTVKGFFHKTVRMEIYLRCDPHTVRVASDRFKAVFHHRTRENYDPFTVFGIGSVYDKSFVSFIFSPSALIAEIMLDPEAVAVAENDLGIADCRSGSKVYFILCAFESGAERKNIINGLTCSDCTLRNIYHAVTAAADICLMLFPEFIRDSLFTPALFSCHRHKYPPQHRKRPHTRVRS